MRPFKSITDIFRRLPSEQHARRFLEELIWPNGRFCPHCGSVETTELKGARTRRGLYQCRDCRCQFTVTTKTPMHSTKLDLRIWIAAMFLILTSSKGISSVALARMIGTTQTTAWKLGHAIREMMMHRELDFLPLDGIVEIDEAYVGGKPKFKHGVVNKRGRGTRKTPILVLATRDGKAFAQVLRKSDRLSVDRIIQQNVDPSAEIKTDASSLYEHLSETYRSHCTVLHGARQYVGDDGVTHINTVESFNGLVKRTLVGVFHRLKGPHLQRYLQEISWRWNHRDPTEKVRQIGEDTIVTTVYRPEVFMEQLADLLSVAVGRQVRRAVNYGLRWPPPIGPGFAL